MGSVNDDIITRQIFRIGTVRYAEGLWRMCRHGPVIAHCTDSEDFPITLLNIYVLLPIWRYQFSWGFRQITNLTVWWAWHLINDTHKRPRLIIAQYNYSALFIVWLSLPTLSLSNRLSKILFSFFERGLFPTFVDSAIANYIRSA